MIYIIIAHRSLEQIQYFSLCIKGTKIDIKRNPNVFWNYFNNNYNYYTIPYEMHLGDQTDTNGIEIVDLFAKFFNSVCEEHFFD